MLPADLASVKITPDNFPAKPKKVAPVFLRNLICIIASRHSVIKCKRKTTIDLFVTTVVMWTDNAEPLWICFLPQYSTPKKVFISERDQNHDLINLTCNHLYVFNSNLFVFCILLYNFSEEDEILVNFASFPSYAY